MTFCFLEIEKKSLPLLCLLSYLCSSISLPLKKDTSLHTSLEAMCNIFENDENKVKEFATTKWLNHSKKLLNSLTCTRRTTFDNEE